LYKALDALEWKRRLRRFTAQPSNFFGEKDCLMGGNWFSWCYQYVWNNVNGTLSACDSNDHSWTASY